MSRLRAPLGAWAWTAVAAAALVAAAMVPLAGSSSDVTDAAIAAGRGAMAAGAALSLAVARPSLALAALGGAGAYTSAVADLHGWPVLASVATGVAVAGVAGAALGVLGLRLSAAAFLALTLVAALAGGALVTALPDQLGGSAGLGPVPPLQVPVGGGRQLVLGGAGMLHATLALCGVAVLGTGALLLSMPGARWRAIGGDAGRSAMAGLRPRRGQLGVLALAGALAGLGGTLGVHAAGVASPAAFSPDAAVVPLVAALLAGRGGPPLAALIGAATAVLELRVLPGAGWAGPPDSQALATGVLAALTLVALPGLLRRGRPRRGDAGEPSPVPALVGSWPPLETAGGSAGLRVRGLPIIPGAGAAPLATLDLSVPAGTAHGLVGPNGAGKSTALAAIAREAGRGSGRVEAGGPAARVVLLPQSGGGWPGTTVAETLRLAAGAGGRSPGAARDAAARWSARLGLDPLAFSLCETLSHGARRRVELARVLLLRPSVLLCDEPLAGLGPVDRALVLEGLRAAAEDGVALLVAEHDLASLARLATATTELRSLDGGAVPGTAPA